MRRPDVKQSGGLSLSTLWKGPSVETRMPWSRIRFATYPASSPAGSRV